MRCSSSFLFATLFFGAVSSVLCLPRSNSRFYILPWKVGPLARNVITNTNAAPSNDLMNLVSNSTSNTTAARPIAVIIAEAQFFLENLTDKICTYNFSTFERPFTEINYIIAFANIANATSRDLRPIVNEVNSIISAAVTEIEDLVGQPNLVVFATMDGTGQITVLELAQVVRDFLKCIITAFDNLSETIGMDNIDTLVQGVLYDVVWVSSTLFDCQY